MGKIGLVATDLDGTFLVSGDQMHPENIEALRACERAGVYLCACTGRTWGETRNIVRRARMGEFAVVNNGAAIIRLETEEEVFCKRFDTEQVQKILSIGLEIGACHVAIAGREGLYSYEGKASDYFYKRRGQLAALGEPGWETIVIAKDREEMVQRAQGDMEGVQFIFDTRQQQELLRERADKAVGIEMTRPGFSHIEVSPKGCTKAHALSLVAAHYGVPQSEVMALGDSFNDLEMLQWAGVSVAMDNADPELKAQADFVAGHNRDAGFAKAIRRLALNEAMA